MLPLLFRVLATISLALLLAVAAQAQSEPPHPDLSGTWVFNSAKSKLAKHADSIAETLVISVSGGTIQFHYSGNGKDNTEEFIVDSKEHVVAQFKGGQDVQKAGWKKGTLVIEVIGRVHGPDPNSMGDDEVFHGTERWTLSPDGRSLTNKSSGGLGDMPGATLVYDKR